VEPDRQRVSGRVEERSIGRAAPCGHDVCRRRGSASLEGLDGPAAGPRPRDRGRASPHRDARLARGGSRVPESKQPRSGRRLSGRRGSRSAGQRRPAPPREPWRGPSRRVDVDCRTGQSRAEEHGRHDRGVGRRVLAPSGRAEGTPRNADSCILLVRPAGSRAWEDPIERGSAVPTSWIRRAASSGRAFHQLLNREPPATRYQDFFSVCLVQPDGVASMSTNPCSRPSRKIAQFLRSRVVARTRDASPSCSSNADHDATRVAERSAHTWRTSSSRSRAAPRRVTFPSASCPSRATAKRAMLLTRAQARLQTAASAAAPGHRQQRRLAICFRSELVVHAPPGAYPLGSYKKMVRVVSTGKLRAAVQLPLEIVRTSVGCRHRRAANGMVLACSLCELSILLAAQT